MDQKHMIRETSYRFTIQLTSLKSMNQLHRRAAALIVILLPPGIVKGLPSKFLTTESATYWLSVVRGTTACAPIFRAFSWTFFKTSEELLNCVPLPSIIPIILQFRSFGTSNRISTLSVGGYFALEFIITAVVATQPQTMREIIAAMHLIMEDTDLSSLT